MKISLTLAFKIMRARDEPDPESQPEGSEALVERAEPRYPLGFTPGDIDA